VRKVQEEGGLGVSGEKRRIMLTRIMQYRRDKRRKFEIKNIFNNILSNKYLYIKIIG